MPPPPPGRATKGSHANERDHPRCTPLVAASINGLVKRLTYVSWSSDHILYRLLVSDAILWGGEVLKIQPQLISYGHVGPNPSVLEILEHA